MGLQGDTCKDGISMIYVMAVATNSTVADVKTKFESNRHLTLEITDDKLNVVETDLNKHYASEKVQFIMQILRGLKAGSSKEDNQKAMVIDNIRTYS